MKINTSYISEKNTYERNNPEYIVVHNPDNFAQGADARAHASAQFHGNFNGMSAHYYVDDKEIVYQAAKIDKGCWHVGVDYGGKFFGVINNRNSIGVEMCVQKGYDFEKAFRNTVELVKYLMKSTGIPADHVVQHYDVCLKNCPSEIRKHGMWNIFKQRLDTRIIKTLKKASIKWLRMFSISGPETQYCFPVLVGYFILCIENLEG